MSALQIGIPDEGRVQVFSEPEMLHYLEHYQSALEIGIGGLVGFNLPMARTLASTDTAEIIAFAMQAARVGHNAYLHTHLHSLPKGELPRRGAIDTVAAAIGVFSDIDAQGPGRKKPAKTLCPTVQDALWIVEELERRFPPLRAGIVIDSGHGCYPVALFREPFVIASADDRARLDALSRRFHAALHQIASERGWRGAVDFCDLAKVLRLPGTTNWKDATNPRMVRVVMERPDRFDISELEEILPPVQAAFTQPERPSVTVAADLILQSPLPPGFIELLLDTDSDFARLYRYERGDMDDQSCSGYDLAIAAYGVGMGFSDTQIAALIIDNRRRFPRDHQDRRGAAYVKYIERTIAKARESAAARESVRAANTTEPKVEAVPQGTAEKPQAFGITEDDEDDPDDEDEEEDDEATPVPAKPAQNANGTNTPDENVRAAAREIVHAILKLDIESVTKHGKQRGQYTLNLADGRKVELGTAKTLNSQTEFRTAVIDGLNLQLPVLSRKRWKKAIDALLLLVDVVETLTTEEMIADEVAHYLFRRGAFVSSIRCSDRSDMTKGVYELFRLAKAGNQPICETEPGGRAIITLRGFLAWLQLECPKHNLTAVDVAGLLSRVGFTRLSTLASPTWQGRRVKLNRLWTAPLDRLGVDPTEAKEQYTTLEMEDTARAVVSTLPQ